MGNRNGLSRSDERHRTHEETPGPLLRPLGSESGPEDEEGGWPIMKQHGIILHCGALALSGIVTSGVCTQRAQCSGSRELSVFESGVNLTGPGRPGCGVLGG